MIALWLAGCRYSMFFPPGLSESGDTGAGGVIRSLDWGCDPGDTAWTWEVRLDRWASAAPLDLVRTSDGAHEEHELELVESDPGGRWEQRRAGPLVVTVDTRFDCEADADRLSFGIRIRAVDGALVECAVGGADPAGATAALRELDADVDALGDCRLAE